MPGPTDAAPETASPWLLARSAAGGVLMGLANLVPGISGGTMLLAAGVYPRFITGVAEITTLRFRPVSLTVLAGVGGAAVLAILLLAGVVKDLVVAYRWVMYSLFIGLTLGGVPVVYRLLGKMSPSAWTGAIAGFVGMALLGVAQAQGVTDIGGTDAGVFMFFLAGLAGAAAMILPGVSGGYLLLVMGMYVPVLAGIETFKEGLTQGDVPALVGATLGVVLPVGIGVVVGVVAVSNVLEWLLRTYRSATLGVLLGLLVGAVIGLWPFQQGIAPQVGDTWRGRAVTAAYLAELDPEDYPTQTFAPSPGQAVGSILVVLLGLGITLGIARVSEQQDGEAAPAR